MHNCEISPPPPPPAKGAKLLLQLGQLIVHSRHPSPSPPSPQPLDALATASSSPLPVSAALPHVCEAAPQEDGHGRLLQAKLLAARSLMPELPSTSKESSEELFRRSFKLKESEGWKGVRGAGGAAAAPGLDAAAVGEAVSKAQRALYLDAQLNFHVQALWAERVPVCIDVLLGSGCRQCVGGDPLLLERWTLTVRTSKSVEKPSFITSQWLLNAVRSQLHFSQITAWRAKLRSTADPPTDPQERQRRRSRETCNYKKLESNCDEDELTGDEDCRDDKEVRKLNIVYQPRLDGDASDFTRTPTAHRFPATDIGADLLLEVLLESLPRSEEIPSVKCLCSSTPAKRRASRDSTPLSQHEELACRMHHLTLGPTDPRNQHLRTKGATFSPDLGLINSNIGSSSGISRKLSIFSTSGAEYNGSTRISTPERQFYNDSGYPESSTQSPVYRGSPSNDRKSIQLDHPYFKQSLSLKKETVVRANYLLVDDRMHTPCSESGKHRCSCDDESDQGKEFNPRSSTSLTSKEESGRKVLDERRLKEIAKYKRRLRKEIKLKKMRESGTSDSAGTSECADKGPEPKEKEEGVQTTSIPILQASRFDRMRAIGCYRNQTYLTLPANCRGEERSYRDAACDTIGTSAYHTPRHKEKSVASIATQTEDVVCACGEPVDLKCDLCKRKMVRSEGSYDLARVNQSEMLLEAMERTSQLHSPSKPCVRKERDEPCCDAEKVMKKHKCDNNDRNLKCDTFSFSDSLGGVRKCSDDDAANAGIIKRPKLKRIFPIVERIGRVVTDRRQADDATSDIDELLLKDDDSVFTYMAKSHSTPKSEESAPLTRHRSSASDDDYVLYEKCDYGTFDRFDNPETLVRDDSDSEIKRDSSEWSLERYISNGKECGRSMEKQRRGKGSEQLEVPSPSEMEGFRWRLDSAASMVFHARTGLPLTSSPAPLRRGNSCFDYDSTITGISGIKSALFHPVSPPEGWWSPCSSPGSPAPAAAAAAEPPPAAPLVAAAAAPPAPRRAPAPPRRDARLKLGVSTGLLGSFEESALNGRLEPVATVHGFTAELGASGAFCPPHRRLPVTVFFYALGGTNAPYLGHINLGASGYRVPRSGTVQVSLFNPHGTLVKMFVVLYELADMPPCARTFLRQRTLYVPCDLTAAPPPHQCYRWLRYLIHLRFLTSKTGKLYLHTDIRIIVSRKADLDTATAHSPIYSSLKLNSTNQGPAGITAPNHNKDKSLSTNEREDATNEKKDEADATNRKIIVTELKAELNSAFAAKDAKATTRPGTVNRVFGGCDEQDIEEKNYDYDAAKSDCDFLAGRKMNRSEACMELSTHCDDKNDSYDVGGKVENSQNVSYELRSFTYAPDNPKYSPR